MYLAQGNFHVHTLSSWATLNTLLYQGNVYQSSKAWWRHQMETFSALLAICAENSPVPGEFPTQRPVTRSFDVHFDLRPNKRLSKQSLGWWFETLSPPLWRHRNGGYMMGHWLGVTNQFKQLLICSWLLIVIAYIDSTRASPAVIQMKKLPTACISEVVEILPVLPMTKMTFLFECIRRTYTTPNMQTMLSNQIFDGCWHICVSVNRVTIGSDPELSPIWDLNMINFFQLDYRKYWSKWKYIFHGNATEILVC